MSKRPTKQQLLDYAVRAVDDILKMRGKYIPEGQSRRKAFVGGLRPDEKLRKTQHEALLAYRAFLKDTSKSVTDRLTGFFDIPTGIGKTGPFVKIVAGMYRHALKDGFNLNARIVVPTKILMHQTANEQFVKYEPEMREHIGFYGDGHKQLDRPITIMTYNAWSKLTQRKIIHGGNTDIFISDEGHRGLSVNREKKLLKAFNGHTMKLAFTATSRFDTEKVLERTHKNRIYEKPISVALRDDEGEGELVEYAHVHFYTIRVDPKDVEEMYKYLDEVVDPEWKYWKTMESRIQGARLMAKKKAWNARALKIFARGNDTETGDPLSDNPAAFYVKDTRQANTFAEMLNDPKQNMGLSKIAKERGCESVAVAIHSRGMSSKEQEWRLEAFKAGKYLAIVGDEKFKEGFDHAPLKTIIDWPHKSLVDKAQIVGRGTRRYKNKEKDRQEGLTFVDIVIYVGSDKPEEDAYLKREAIKRAVLAADILGGDFILRGAKKQKPEMMGIDEILFDWRKSETDDFGDQAEVVKDLLKRYGDDIADMADIIIEEGIPENEPVFVQYHEKRKVYLVKRNLRIAALKILTEPVLAEDTRFEKKFERLSKDFGRKIKDVPCVVVTKPSRKPLFANDPDVEEFSTLEETRTFVRGRKRSIDSDNQPKEGMVEITTEMLKKMRADKKRTGVGSIDLIKKAENVPEGLNHKIIEGWFHETSKIAKKDYLEWAMARWSSLPNASKIIKITDSMRLQLQGWREKTQLGPHVISNRTDKPEDLTRGMIVNIFIGHTAVIRNDHWKWIKKVFQEFSKTVKITQNHLEKMHYQKERTGVDPVSLIANADDVPFDLTAHKIKTWLNGSVKEVPKQHLSWVISQWESLPDFKILNTVKKIVITESMREQLVAEKERTGVGSVVLLSTSNAKVPLGLSPQIVTSWFGGSVAKVSPDFWNWVMESYKKLPDKPKSSPSGGGGWMGMELGL